MGAYLDCPIKDKNATHGNTDICWWGACSMQGWRCSMEDTEITDSIDLGKGEKGMLFAVFDGHGGKEVAEYAKAEFKKVLMD